MVVKEAGENWQERAPHCHLLDVWLESDGVCCQGGEVSNLLSWVILGAQHPDKWVREV